MKLVNYQKDGYQSCGVVIGEKILDIPGVWTEPAPPRNVKEAIKRNVMGRIAELSVEKQPLIPLKSVRILSPVLGAGKLIALAGNYSEHIKEAGGKLGLSDSPRETTVPRLFLMPGTALAGPGDIIQWPVYSEKIDYELELAVVIGKTAKCIDARSANDYIAGYTIANDISARSVTFEDGRGKRPWDEFYDWLNGKWADGFLPTGPYLVTRDEIQDVQKLKMTLKVNDQIRQDSNTGQMIYNVGDIVSFVSHIMTLEAGDVIATGTPAGVGLGIENFLQAGDKIEASIEELGTLTNIIGARPEEFYTPLIN
ncbi:MAG: fumarylacetoacetate hydrolase family protein [Phycisphaerae bacterium]|nr:fumarylacetoacetate hydrolase family protein [Phycisphaerae bacterium]